MNLLHGVCCLLLINSLPALASPAVNNNQLQDSTCTHPLDPLTRAEIAQAVERVKAYKPLKNAFYPTVVLNEPPKHELLAYQPGLNYRREAFVDVFDSANNALYQALVDLKADKVVRFEQLPEGTQPPVYDNEYDVVPNIIKQDRAWQEAMKKRGINPEQVYLDVWSGGHLPISVDRDGHKVKPGTRILRVLSFFRGSDNQPNPYDRPIEGVVVAVDMNQLKVLQVTDTVVAPVSSYNGDDTNITQPAMKPIHVSQPEGKNYHVCGHEIHWQNWHFRYALHPRDGLVLYNIRYRYQDRDRPIAHRLSLTEIYVPYGIPDSNWLWRSAFDVGEYGMGRFVNPLISKVDVPDNTEFFSAELADDQGGTKIYQNAVGLYERYSGLLWKRVDPESEVQQANAAVELVLTSNSWIGNYIYGIHYIFQLNGALEIRVDATGTTLNQGINHLADGNRYGHVVDQAPAVTGGMALVAAPNHQHFFNFRADLDIDGVNNRIYQSDVKPEPNVSSNAFASHDRLVERETAVDLDLNQARSWKIASSHSGHNLTTVTGYTLTLGDTAMPYATTQFPARQRAGFVEHPLWLTQYKDYEHYATGAYPNQAPPGQGLPAYTGNESLVDKDAVLWITAGLTHIPDVEQYPVMNTETLKVLRLSPFGFFRRNPALTLQ